MRQGTRERIEKTQLYLTMAFEAAKCISGFTLIAIGLRNHFYQFNFVRNTGDIHDYQFGNQHYEILPLCFLRNNSSCSTDDIFNVSSHFHYSNSHLLTNSSCVPESLWGQLAANIDNPYTTSLNTNPTFFQSWFIYINAAVLFTIAGTTLPLVSQFFLKKIRKIDNRILKSICALLLKCFVQLVNFGIWLPCKALTMEYLPNVYWNLQDTSPKSQNLYRKRYSEIGAVFSGSWISQSASVWTVDLCVILYILGLSCYYVTNQAACQQEEAVIQNNCGHGLITLLLKCLIGAVFFASCVAAIMTLSKISILPIIDSTVFEALKEAFINFDLSSKLQDINFTHTARLPIFLTCAYIIFNTLIDTLLFAIDRAMACCNGENRIWPYTP